MMASRLIGKKFYPYILGGVAVPREASDALLPVIDKYTLQARFSRNRVPCQALLTFSLQRKLD
jgi:hypothetical protein